MIEYEVGQRPEVVGREDRTGFEAMIAEATRVLSANGVDPEVMMQAVDSTAEASVEASEAAWRGIEFCRQGDWQEGLYWLSLAADVKTDTSELPSLFFAYLGYGLARYRGKTRHGLELCRRAVELEFYQPENYYFLALTHLLMGDRRSAIEAIEGGLQVDSTHHGLTGLRNQLGARLPPVLSFLPRQHLLNRTLGRFRHRLLRRHERAAGIS